MNLYLVQHGEAVAKAVDPERPLTEAGAEGVRRLAAFLAKAGVRVERVLNSGKRRARETADILASAVAPGIAVEDAGQGLNPKDSTDWLAKRTKEWSEDTLVVGHQPFMGRMVARLVTGSEGKGLVALSPGTVVCLQKDPEDGTWAIGWMITPVLLAR